LEQAGAYICRHRLSFTDYLKAWRVNHDKVLEWFDERLMRYPKSVAVTWQTSFGQLTASARRLLHRLAWFAPDPISELLLDAPLPATGGPAFGAGPPTPPKPATTGLPNYESPTDLREA